MARSFARRFEWLILLHRTRWLLLAVILLAFARLCWGVEAKDLWWDESLSLQRAESQWGDLLLGRLILSDGVHEIVTLDQHPFVFFAILGLFVRLAGDSEYVLRFPSILAATLLAPTAWALVSRLSRRGAYPRGAPWWSALLAAASPFYLWYGQEARMYTLLAWLALLSVYLLLRWSDAPLSSASRRRWLWGYVLVAFLLLGAHYLSVLLIPVHAFLVYQGANSRRRGALGVAILLALGAIVAALAAWVILRSGGGGANFSPVSLRVLLPDLLNAFSLGLSVDITQVKWLDAIFGVVALGGLAWGCRSQRSFIRGGWLLPAMLIIPVMLLMAIETIQPAYMNARHLSLISGAFLALVGAGLGAIGRWRKEVAVAAGCLLVAGMGYSTASYFTLPQYAKDDFTGLGLYLRSELQPGDLLLLDPPEMLRLYRYYLPVGAVERARREGYGTRWHSVPLFSDWDQTQQYLEELLSQHRRIWLVDSGMVPFSDPKRKVQKWLLAHAVRVRERGFRSPNAFLELNLFLPRSPIAMQGSVVVPHAVDGVFGDRVRLRGFDLGRPLPAGENLPITLYWQAIAPLDRRYKYILEFASLAADGRSEIHGVAEREPYDGTLPTPQWPPDATVIEYSGVIAPIDPPRVPQCCQLRVQIYDAETLTKLPVTDPGTAEVAADGQTLVIPVAP